VNGRQIASNHDLRMQRANLMPDPLLLKVGDFVRFVRIPDEWSQSGHHVPRETMAFMKKMIRRSWPSRISQLDDSGYPWVEARIRERGKLMHHIWLITESTGWRRVRRRTPRID